MHAHVRASPDDIDITEVWAALRRRLPKLALWSAATAVVTYGVLSLEAPRYESEAQLAIVAKGTANPFADPSRETAPSDAYSVRMDKEAINTHLRALMSPDLAEKIATEMKLADRVEFNSALGSPDVLSRLLRLFGIGGPRPGESEHDRVLSAFFSHLDVYSPKESRFIGIRFSSIDPELAAAVANKIAETYRETLATQTVVETDEVQKALEPKIAKLAEEVASAEADVEHFKAEANIFKGGQQSTGLNEQQLAELTAELSKAKAQRSEAEARAKSAREMLKSGGAEALPDVQKSPLIQNLVQQRVRVERQISELSATLLPGHPRMRQLNADLAGLKRQIDSEVTKVVDSLEKEAKVAALREDSITKSLNEIKARVVTTGPDEVKLRTLEANAKTKRAELERLQAQFEANRARAVPVEAQVVTTARPSSVPSFPKKLPYALLVATATLLLGLAWVVTCGLLAGARRPKVPTARNGERAPPARAACEEPTLAPVAARSPLPARPPEPLASERIPKMASIADIASRLDAKIPEAGGFRTLIAGETDSIDPGAEADELAQALSAYEDTVIIVDWSPEGEGVAAALGVTLAPGMTELLEGSATFEDVIKCVPEREAHIIACGEAATDIEACLDPNRLNLVLDALDEAYDHIVVVARHEAARVLFETIQGRFDAGIIVSDAKRRVSVIQDPPGTFLGYEVADMELLRFERPALGPVAGERLLRARAGSRVEGHPA